LWRQERNAVPGGDGWIEALGERRIELTCKEAERRRVGGVYSVKPRADVGGVSGGHGDDVSVDDGTGIAAGVCTVDAFGDETMGETLLR
jgi:hypothetical protein